ncbi:MAG: hypothetical protein DMG21_13715 [Acidobacteria bacterium]|nr:MAG: hypothetical protein DMG21_13715 [Acidobacteriota bacterium]
MANASWKVSNPVPTFEEPPVLGHETGPDYLMNQTALARTTPLMAFCYHKLSITVKLFLRYLSNFFK